MRNIDIEAHYLAGVTEAGCDEAGRGCLAGPVFAAAVILPADIDISLLNDSKQLTKRQRNVARQFIEANAIDWAIASIDNQEIDEINILNASIKAMHNALAQLKQQPEHIIVDGNRFINYNSIPYKCIIKGDCRYASIAAASILAKTYRDEYMQLQHEKYPMYNWEQNKGYPTVKHRNAIAKHGICPLHRKTFRLFTNQTTINFE